MDEAFRKETEDLVRNNERRRIHECWRPENGGGVKRVKLLYEKAKVAKDEGYGDRRPVIGISPMSYTTEDLSRETYDRIDGALK